MEENWKRMTQWAVEKIRREYPEDIALLVAVDGAEVDGDGHGSCFDYFVPITERGYALGRDFILGDGVGCDLYPRSWERTERTAELLEQPFCVYDARILYSRTPEDEARFSALQERQRELLRDPAVCYQRAREKLEAVMELYRTMLFEESPARVRLGAVFAVEWLREAVCLLNGTISQPHRLERVDACRRTPERFRELTEELTAIGTPETLRELVRQLLVSFRRFAEDFAPPAEKPAQPNWAELGDWYGEMSLTWRRLRYRCRVGDARNALRDAGYLQAELQALETQMGLSDTGLLAAYDQGGLTALARRADALEQEFTALLRAQDAMPPTWATVDGFLADN